VKRKERPKYQRKAFPQLVEKLAYAAWKVLNHDNDPDDGEEWNTANWNAVCQKISAVLKNHRTRKEKP